MTHAGWSSIVEAIQFEKPLLLLTVLADQGINARLLEEKKVAYLIPRNDWDRSFTHDAVIESLYLVLLKKEGEIYRKKIKEVKNLCCDKKRQDDYVENLLRFLQNYKKTIP